MMQVFSIEWPRWAQMWALAFTLYFCFKWLTWQQAAVRDAALWRHPAYLLAWPGMDAASFLEGARSEPSRCRAFEWAAAVGKLALGVVLWFGIARLFSQQPYLAGWIGGTGLVLILHFGLFHLLWCGWRRIGIPARQLMDRPLTSASLGEFWGRRWNTSFRDLTHRLVFRPSASRVGTRWGLLASFLFSGVIHDLVISVPARGGYGAPTVYLRDPGRGSADRTKCIRPPGWIAVGPVGSRVRGACAARTRAVAVPSSLHDRHHAAVHARVWSIVMDTSLARFIYLAGVAQLSILIASALVPVRLNWHEELRGLSRLHRQMYWTYGGYVVLSILAFAVISLMNADELAGGGALARGFCAYVAVFWGIRAALQLVFDVKAHLTARWLKAGYVALSLMFVALTMIYGWAALPRRAGF